MCSILCTLCLAKCFEPCCGCCCGGTKDVPLKAEQLTPDVLTLMLREGGVLDIGESVISVKLKKFQDGMGFMSLLYRVELKYDPAEKGPASLVCKLPPTLVKARILGTYLNLFEAEVYYYQNNISEATGMPAPKSYFAKYQGYGRFALLLEDLSPAKTTSIIEGSTSEQAMIAITNVAKLHATFRGRVTTDDRTKDWILRCDDAPYFKLVGKTFREAVDILNDERFKLFGVTKKEVNFFYDACHFLSTNWDMISLMSANGMKRNSNYAMFTRTFLHGDFHIENMFFDVGEEDGKESFKIIDYQLVSEGDGCRDVAYYNVYNLEPEKRKEYEKNIIRLYYDEMHKNGAKDFSMTECLISYVISLYFPVLIATIAQKDSSGAESEEGKNKIKAFMKRVHHAIEDWNWINAMKIVFEKSKNGITQLTMDEVRKILPLEYHDLIVDMGEMGDEGKEAKIHLPHE